MGLFQCPSGSNIGKTLNTDYVAVIGSETAFPGSETVAIAEIKDGVENTILLVEIADSDIHWMEPRDLSWDRLEMDDTSKSREAIQSNHPAGSGVVFADRITTYRLQSPLSTERIRALLTIAGGESVDRDSLAHGSVLSDESRQNNDEATVNSQQESGGRPLQTPPQ